MEITFCFVRIDYTDCLQIGIDDGRTDKTHPARLQIVGDGIGKRICRLACFIKNPLARKGFEIVVKRAVFLDNRCKNFAVVDARLNFESVADNILVLQERLYLFIIISANLSNSKPSYAARKCSRLLSTHSHESPA